MLWRPSCDAETLAARHRLLRSVRGFFDDRGYVEVQTACLAEHTVTDVAIESMACRDGGYLRTSPEHQLKRLLCAGAPSLYEIGPVFRAGERGRWHNPEFTMLEWYRLGYDDRDLMAEVGELVDSLLGPAAYVQRSYLELLRFDPAALSLAQLRHRAGGPPTLDRDGCVDLLIANAIERCVEERVFVTEYPADQAALARVVDGVARRFELIVDGLEIANGYWELADAAELEARMHADAAMRRSRGLPAVAPDARLIAAQHQGLPDCAGVAVGLDRLFALALGAPSVAGVMPFPADRA